MKKLLAAGEEIVRVIHKGKLRDDIRDAITESASENKRKTIGEIIKGNAMKSFSTNPLKWLGKLAVSSASEYFTQRKETSQNDDGDLRLKHDELDEYDELQRKLLGSSWSLLRQYHIPDNYRLTQNALKKFSAAMNESDPSKRNRMMKYLEGDFSMYAPYWFYRAKSANEAGNDDEAGKYFARFWEVWQLVLRKDPCEPPTTKVAGFARSLNLSLQPLKASLFLQACSLRPYCIALSRTQHYFVLLLCTFSLRTRQDSASPFCF